MNSQLYTNISLNNIQLYINESINDINDNIINLPKINYNAKIIDIYNYFHNNYNFNFPNKNIITNLQTKYYIYYLFHHQMNLYDAEFYSSKFITSFLSYYNTNFNELLSCHNANNDVILEYTQTKLPNNDIEELCNSINDISLDKNNNDELESESDIIEKQYDFAKKYFSQPIFNELYQTTDLHIDNLTTIFTDSYINFYDYFSDKNKVTEISLLYVNIFISQYKKTSDYLSSQLASENEILQYIKND